MCARGMSSILLLLQHPVLLRFLKSADDFEQISKTWGPLLKATVGYFGLVCTFWVLNLPQLSMHTVIFSPI